MIQNKFNIQIPTEWVPDSVSVTKEQKRVLEELIKDIYESVGSILIFEDEEQVVEVFKDKAEGRFRELIESIFDNNYIIEVKYKNTILIFDVETMIKDYGYDKEVIRKQIETKDMERIILWTDISYFIFDKEYWNVNTNGNRITIGEKMAAI